MNGIWVSGDIPRLDGRKPTCGIPAVTRLVSLGLPASPHHPWPAQPDYERSHFRPLWHAGLRDVVVFYSPFQHVLI
jgi:hypothetical protein